MTKKKSDTLTTIPSDEDDATFLMCPFCGDASDSCDCDDLFEDLDDDDSWFTDPEEGAR